jgi:hypothetical protein
MGLSKYVAVVAVLTAGFSSQAFAYDNYGAIAFSNSTGAWGTAYDYGSRQSAEQAAVNRCGAGCFAVVWFRNACGALASTRDHGYGSGWATDLGVAQNIAIQGCSQYGSCTITAWACTTR